jgi:hypothetical protein
MTKRLVRVVGGALAIALIGPACGGGDGDGSVTASSSAPSSPLPTDVPATTADPAGTSSTAPASSDGAQIPPLLDGGVVGGAALAAVLAGENELDQRALDAFAAEFAALPLDRQEAIVSDLSLRVELAAAEVSGLEAAAGDRAAAETALAGAFGQVRSQSDAAAASVSLVGEPAGFRHGFAAAAAPSSGAVAAVGLFMGYMALATFGKVVTEQSNGWSAGQTDVHEGDGIVFGASVDEVNAELRFTGKQDGVDVDFTAGAVIHPCPNPDGSFQLQALIDVKASKGGAGQNARMELRVDGTLDDNAELASKNVENHTQWSDFANSSGQFIDFTMTGPNGVESSRMNRTGGRVTDEFASAAALLSTLIGLLIATQLVDATEQAWKSGRCVDLKVTPSAGPAGLEPSQVVDVLAQPRSKVDGAPTGGMVTATLTAGASSVEPDGSPVPADANSTYTAAPEQDEQGTVSYESRSRRGVGKASITFTTNKPAAYLVVGGLEDWQVNMVVCDVTKPFTLESPGVGVAEFSGGLSGSYSATGVFNFSYAGTYEITLENGLGTPGGMIATSGGQIAGEAGSGSEVYVLTPATC